MEEYLRQEFYHSTIPKYYKYFDEWFRNLTPRQLLYYRSYMVGHKTPFDSGQL